MRQNKDIHYATLLENLWIGNIFKLDFDLLKTCLLSNLNVNLFDDPWRTSTFIVPRNELWNAINHYMIDIHSKTSKQKCYIIVTYIIRQTMSTSKTQCLTPFFKVYKGMKIIIIENLYPKFRIVNGSIGYIKNMSLANSEWI